MLIREIEARSAVSGRFLIIEAQLRTAKNGSRFISLRLGDRSGEIAAKVWDADENIFARLPAGQVVEVRDLAAKEFAGTIQLELDGRGASWRLVPENEVDFAEFLPSSASSLSLLWRQLDETITGINEPHLRAIVDAFFGDARFRELFGRMPAALKRHHVYVGGLLEHTCGVVALCEAAARIYPLVDRDLLITGAILHDLGKVGTYRIGRSFEGTDEGKLLGHLILGVQLVADEIRILRERSGDAERGFPEELRLCLEHLLISHHGIMEWGSPVEPVSLEACLLHHADNMDAQAAKFLSALRTHQPAAGLWTNYDPGMGRSVYTGRARPRDDAGEGA